MTAAAGISARQRLDAVARVFCYVLGPFSAALMLRFGRYAWSVRFHAFHSMLMTSLWALVWTLLRGIEAIFPWFLSTAIRQLRFAVNLSFLLIWVCLLAT